MIQCAQVINLTCDICGVMKQLETIFNFDEIQPKVEAVMSDNGWNGVIQKGKTIIVCPKHKVEHYSGFMIDGEKV